MLERERAQDEAVDDREDGRGRTDRDGQTHSGEHEQSGRAAEAAKRDAKIGRQGRHRTASANAMVAQLVAAAEMN